MILTSTELREVSVLFNEPKLLKLSISGSSGNNSLSSFSALQRAEIAEIVAVPYDGHSNSDVSVLFNEPKLLKSGMSRRIDAISGVSVLFNEPKLLKSLVNLFGRAYAVLSFSALQRAEIAEMLSVR